MDISELVQLGALGVIAVMMISKDAKRDAFLQKYLDRMCDTIDKNTAAFIELRQSIERGMRNDSEDNKTGKRKSVL